MATEIHLTTVTNEGRALDIAARIKGMTYLILYANVCPYQGEFRVNVGTLRKKTFKAELTGVVLDLLAAMIPTRATP